MNLLNLFEPVQDGVPETHVWMGPFAAKKCLPQHRRDEFYSAYNQLLFHENSKGLHIAEKPRKTSDSAPTYVPLVVDIDLHCPLEEAHSPDFKLYSEQDAVEVIRCFHRVLEKSLVCPKAKPDSFTCFLLEKPPRASEKGQWKNGFHLHFPFMLFPTSSIKEIIFPAVKLEMDAFCFDDGRRLFGLEKASVALDTNTPCIPWLMYGSKKNETSDPYLVSQIFDRGMQKITLESVVEKEKFLNTEGEILTFTGYEKHALVRLLSIDTVCIANQSLKKKLKLKRIDASVSYGPLFSSFGETVEGNVTRVKQLVELLSPARASAYETWFQVLITIFNVTGGSEEGFQAWKSFSETASNYDESATYAYWKNAASRPRQASLRTREFGSLVHWAREDNPDAVAQLYNQWKSNSRNKLLRQPTDWNIATHFFEKHKADYVYFEKTWYQYNGIVWEPLTDPLTRMRKNIVDLSSEWNRADLDDADHKRHEALVKKLEGSDQSSIMNQATTVFEIRDFGKLLDSNPAIIAFANGIFDLEKLIFRKASPFTDYESKHLPIPYEVFDRDDPDVRNLENFFEKLFPRDDLRVYFLTQLAEIFWGANRDKVAMFWIGTGNNGKSVMQILLEKMLGPFSRKLSTTVLTSKRPQQGAATPELAGCKGVRWVMMEEFNSQEEIEVGTLKQLTGNDTLTARHLYGSQFEYVPAFKLAVASNSFPKLRAPDEATWNRVRVIPFESCFVAHDEAPKTFQEQKQKKIFPQNPNITSEFPNMAKVLAWYLLEIFKESETKRRANPAWAIPLPDIVVSEKEKYKKTCNKIQQFADQAMQLCDHEDREKNGDVVFMLFKEWWCDNGSSSRHPPRCDFEAEMTRIGSKDKKFYKLKPQLL